MPEILPLVGLPELELTPRVQLAPEEAPPVELVVLPPEGGAGGAFGPSSGADPLTVGPAPQPPAEWASAPAPGAVAVAPAALPQTLPALPAGRLPRTELEHLAALDAAFRPVVVELMQALRRLGYQPLIASSWRGLDVQRALFKAGQTKVLCGFHNITKAGRPASLAVDLVDRRYGWSDKPGAISFFKVLGAEAYRRGLHWGGSTRSGFSMSNPIYARHGLSWDPVHVQALPNSALASLCRGSR